MVVQFSAEVNTKDSQPLAGGHLLPSSKPATMRVLYSGTDTLPRDLQGAFESAPPQAVKEASNESPSIAIPSSATPPLLAENDADTVARSGLMAQLAEWLT